MNLTTQTKPIVSPRHQTTVLVDLFSKFHCALLRESHLESGDAA